MNRLVLERNEARLLGYTKVAKNLDVQISENPVRADGADYAYNYQDLQQDIESSLWDAAMRTQDFYAKTVDARDLQDLIEKHAEDFIHAFRVKSGALSGAYEQILPGEEREVSIISVSSDDLGEEDE